MKLKETDYINWWEATYEDDLEELKTTFTYLFSDIEFLPSIYYPILYKYLKNSQMKHWNKEIFIFSKNKIKEIDNIIDKDSMNSTLLSNIHLLTNTYQNLLDLEDRIMLMDRFKGSEELKAKIFSINIYNDLLNTAFSNTLKLFIEFQSIIESKKLTQKSLTPQIECLASPKRGYCEITDLADSNIRNAISHGGVKIEGSMMFFSYNKKGIYENKEISVYQFKDAILQLYDGISATLLAWIEYLCEKNISYDEINGSELVHEDTSLFYEKLSMSTILTTCDRVSQLEINKGNNTKKQVNIEFSGVDLNIDSRLFLSLYTADRIFDLRGLSRKDSIMISFRSPKTINSFIIINCSLIHDLSNNIMDIEEATKIVRDSENKMMFPINDENRNEFEDNFRYYPDIETHDFFIKEIEDISNEEKKRLKAVVYLKRAIRKNHVKKAVASIIEILKSLENYGFSSHKVKHGKMDTDIIYLVLYKQEVRRGEDRSLLPNNSNFIAKIQYDIDKKFPIHNNLIDKYLKKRIIETVEYDWNPNF